MLRYAILGMVAGANSYRQLYEFVRVHWRRSNQAFGLSLHYPPSYTGLRLIQQGVDVTALEAAFRAHYPTIKASPSVAGSTAIAVDGQTLRGSIDCLRQLFR